MATQKCASCGTAAGKTAKFCKACGHPLGGDGEGPSTAPAETLTEESVDRLGIEESEDPSLLPAEEPLADRESPESSAHGEEDLPPTGTTVPNGFAVKVINGLSAGTCKGLSEGSVFSVGAGDGADLQIHGDSGVSREHVSFKVKDGALLVRDEGSTNGTFVHVTNSREIGIGDSIVVGATVLKIVAGE